MRKQTSQKHPRFSLDSARGASLREEGANGQSRKEYEEHISVLLKEVVEMLAPKGGDVVLDATAGAGGHSEALLNAGKIELIALDADGEAVARVTKRLKPYGGRARVIEANFRDVAEVLRKSGVEAIDKALFDLGWNRGQLMGRGMSFQKDEPLSMSYGSEPASGFNAADILNTWSEQAIADVLFGYGEERYARRIAKEVVAARAKKNIGTTGELVDIVARAVPAGYRRGKTHFATKTFQALRIAVNDELRSLELGIRGAWSMLTQSGRIAVISFHSIEDRAVKRLFIELAKENGTLITKKPMTAGEAERSQNPSARSAKLRVLQKI